MRRETAHTHIHIHTHPVLSHTCIGVEALCENTQRQQWVDEREKAGGRGISGEQSSRVGGHDAVRDSDAAGHGLHGHSDAEVSSSAVPRQANPLCCGA